MPPFVSLALVSLSCRVLWSVHLCSTLANLAVVCGVCVPASSWPFAIASNDAHGAKHAAVRNAVYDVVVVPALCRQVGRQSLQLSIMWLLASASV